MNTVLFLVSVAWSIRIVINLLSYVQLWFIKEYRFDRMAIHLGTPQGKRIFFPPFRLPRIAPKTIVVALGGFVSLVLIFMAMPAHILLRLLIVDVLTFPITGIVVGLFQIPTRLYHRVLILRATELLRKHKGMIVIGVTGSFGKTSTKEFLATILSGTYTVLKTEASKNSPIAIAETVLKGLTDDTQVFIVEMGAYKKGEIAEMADMVRPQIGIVTAINAQHQDLFGSLDMTMKAKYELIQGLQGKQITIINADNPYTRHMGEWAKRDGRTVWWYTIQNSKFKIQNSKIGTKMFIGSEIEATSEGLQFICTEDKGKANVQANVLGEHQVSNILAAIAAAVASGMDIHDAAKAASRIKPFPKTMEPVKGIHGSTFINDTFNNNPDAAKAAIHFLAKTKGRKILVFQPMIELGTYADETHRQVGRAAARVCDDIILTNKNHYEHFLSGAREVGGEKKVHMMAPRQAALYIQKTIKKGDTVLFKGKEAERILALCYKK